MKLSGDGFSDRANAGGESGGNGREKSGFVPNEDTPLMQEKKLREAQNGDGDEIEIRQRKSETEAKEEKIFESDSSESEFKEDFDADIQPLIWTNVKVVVVFLIVIFSIRFILPKNPSSKALEKGDRKTKKTLIQIPQ
jgi:hypothetical protein